MIISEAECMGRRGGVIQGSCWGYQHQAQRRQHDSSARFRHTGARKKRSQTRRVETLCCHDAASAVHIHNYGDRSQVEVIAK